MEAGEKEVVDAETKRMGELTDVISSTSSLHALLKLFLDEQQRRAMTYSAFDAVSVIKAVDACNGTPVTLQYPQPF